MEIKGNIQNWLIEEKMFKDKVNDPNANFHYIIEYPNGNIMDVIQPNGKEDVIVFGCATQVAPEHLELIADTSDKLRDKFLWNVKLELNQFLVDFDLKIENNMLQQFIITDDLFVDELSKHDFIKTIKKVFKAKIQCVWLIEKTFGQVTPSTHTEPNENNMFV